MYLLFRTALDDPVTLFSPEQFQQTLQQWRKEFTTYCTHLTTTVTEERECVFHVPPYTELSASLRRSVGELATLTLQNSLNSDEIPEFIDTYKSLLNIDRTKEFIGTLDLEKMKECWSRLICDDNYFKGPSVDQVTDDDVDKIKDFILNNLLAGPRILQRSVVIVQ